MVLLSGRIFSDEIVSFYVDDRFADDIGELGQKLDWVFHPPCTLAWGIVLNSCGYHELVYYYNSKNNTSIVKQLHCCMVIVNKKFWLHVREVHLQIENWIYSIIKLLFN